MPKHTIITINTTKYKTLLIVNFLGLNLKYEMLNIPWLNIQEHKK